MFAIETKKKAAAKTREQAKASVAADGGQQMREALAARWAKPGASERQSSRMRARAASMTPAQRSENANKAWETRRRNAAQRSEVSRGAP